MDTNWESNHTSAERIEHTVLEELAKSYPSNTVLDTALVEMSLVQMKCLVALQANSDLTLEYTQAIKEHLEALVSIQSE